jgi:hypothetical protein
VVSACLGIVGVKNTMMNNIVKFGAIEIPKININNMIAGLLVEYFNILLIS